MKKKIHPRYYPKAKVTCACGHTFTTGSTKPEITIEICGACHPFFTGEMKYVDTLGKVEKFQQKQARVAKDKFVKKSLRRQEAKDVKEATEIKKDRETPKTLKEMLKMISS
ncbi:50S ribosomal protein L31 [Patescibacteria group bacterium]